MSRAQVPTGLRSHPYLAANLAELPDELRRAVRGESWLPQETNDIFVVPPQSFLEGWFRRRYVPEQALLFTPDGVGHVQGPVETGQAARLTYLRAADLLYVRLSLLLLYGRLELAGRVNGGPGRAVVEFNTVCWHLLRPFLRELLRRASDRRGGPAPEVLTAEIAAEIDRLPLKFSNGLRYTALLPGENLLGFVFQPAIWTRRWRFLPWQVSANTLLALTDRQVIIVEEEKTGRHAAYGYIFTFLSRVAITAIMPQPGEGWQELLIRLEQGAITAERRVTLEPDTAAEWQELWRRYGDA